MKYLFLLLIVVIFSGCIEPNQHKNITFKNETIKEFMVVSVNQTSFTYINDVFHQEITTNINSKIKVVRNANRTVLVDECYDSPIACPVLYISS